jgi:hypothetical protein
MHAEFHGSLSFDSAHSQGWFRLVAAPHPNPLPARAEVHERGEGTRAALDFSS